MLAAINGRTETVIALLKGKADINYKDNVRVGLAGCMVVSVQGLNTISGAEFAGAKVDFYVLLQRQPCQFYSVNHTDTVGGWYCDI